MKTKLTSFFLAILMFLGLSSCKGKTSNHKEVYPLYIFIDSDKAGTDSIPLSKIASKIEYIPLQTADSILLEYIFHFNIANDFIFVENGLDLL